MFFGGKNSLTQSACLIFHILSYLQQDEILSCCSWPGLDSDAELILPGTLRAMLKRSYRFSGFSRTYGRTHLDEYPSLEEYVRLEEDNNDDRLA